MCLDDTNLETSRRSVLQKMGATAFAGLAVASGTASADVDTSACDCSYEYTCKQDPCGDQEYSEYYRECCTCDNGTVCDDWAPTGNCCPLQP